MSIQPLPFSGPTQVPGFSFTGISAGIKKRPGSLDLALIQCTTPETARIAALFTINVVKAAPVVLGMERLGAGRARAVIVNSGNANACTGDQGYRDAVQMCRSVAEHLRCPEKEVFVSSTGVIGAMLPMDKIQQAIPRLIQEATPKGLPHAAQAICTTDTFPKIYATSVDVGGRTITLSGFAKGSGMIAPNMATMLAYVMTDAVVAPNALTQILRQANQSTFNAITVDGEMSTNDSIFLLASGAAGNAEIKIGTPEAQVFCKALTEVCDFLARQIVRDGEGSTKFVELNVSGLAQAEHLRAVALAIANSALVKTALCGDDANWGRILSAAGAAAARLGLGFQLEQASIAFNDVFVFQNGKPVGAQSEALAHDIIKSGEFRLNVGLGTHATSEKIYFTDLTKEYIRINAEYRS